MDINEAYSLLRKKKKDSKVDSVYKGVFGGQNIYMFVLESPLLDVSKAAVVGTVDKSVSFIEGPSVGVFMTALKKVPRK